MGLTQSKVAIENKVDKYIENINKRSEGVKDLDELRKIYVEEFREMITFIIEKGDVTIPAGTLNLVGSVTPSGSVMVTNTVPVLLTTPIS